MEAAFVVHSSVVLEMILPRQHPAAAEDLLAGLTWRRPLRLVAPDLVYVDAANALRSLARRAEIPDAVAGQAANTLEGLEVETVPSGDLWRLAWPLRQMLPIDSAVYVALAKKRAFPLVTLDEQLAAAGPYTRVEVLLLDDPELRVRLRELRDATR